MPTDRQQQILDAALALIVEEGLDSLTMARLARRVGVTEPALYRHFRNKHDLVRQLVRSLDAGFGAAFAALAPDTPPARALATLMDAVLAELARIRGVNFQFLSVSAYHRDTAIREELQALFRRQRERLAGYLRGAAGRGELRPGLDPDATALAFLGLCQGLVTRSLLSGWQVPPAADSRAVLDVFLKGVIG